MTAPERIWAVHHETQGSVMIGEWPDTARHLGGTEYIRADLAQPAAQVQAEAVAGAYLAVQEIVDKIAWQPATGGKSHDPGLEAAAISIAREIEALTPADAQAALARRDAEARNAALREAARKATSFLVGDPSNGVPLRNPMAHEVADAILALIEKEPTE